MSTVAYKHTLRRHVPSGRDQASPPPSPPDSPKSSASSIKGHHSKRERVKETVDHLLHKLHIPHHHHHHDHVEAHEQGTAVISVQATKLTGWLRLDGRLAPTTPEKRSFSVRRTSRTISLTGKSLKHKSSVATIDVPTLGYKISSAPSSAGSLDEIPIPAPLEIKPESPNEVQASGSSEVPELGTRYVEYVLSSGLR